MDRKIVWNNISFLNKVNPDFKMDILKARLITVPAAPGFVENKNNPYYYEALRHSTFAIIDSSYFALLCKIVGVKTNKYSGYRLIKDLINHLSKNKLKLCIVSPSSEESIRIKDFFIDNTRLEENDMFFYNAPFYKKNEQIKDELLLKNIMDFKPQMIMLCVAGGKQEILGDYLDQNIPFHVTTICTGAAISFFTGSQAKVSSWIDKYYLGWLARTIDNPRIFFKRYINALSFIFIFFKYKVSKK